MADLIKPGVLIPIMEERKRGIGVIKGNRGQTYTFDKTGFSRFFREKQQSA